MTWSKFNTAPDYWSELWTSLLSAAQWILVCMEKKCNNYAENIMHHHAKFSHVWLLHHCSNTHTFPHVSLFNCNRFSCGYYGHFVLWSSLNYPANVLLDFSWAYFILLIDCTHILNIFQLSVFTFHTFKNLCCFIPTSD